MAPSRAENISIPTNRIEDNIVQHWVLATGVQALAHTTPEDDNSNTFAIHRCCVCSLLDRDTCHGNWNDDLQYTKVVNLESCASALAKPSIEDRFSSSGHNRFCQRS